MPFRKIPINSPFLSNAEDASKTSVVSSQRRDVIKDKTGSTVRRPGLTVFNDDLPAPSMGLYYWEFKDKVYLESNGDLYSLDESGVLTLEAPGMFSGGNVSWAETTNTELVTAGAVRKLFMASGGPIGVFDGSAGVTLTGVNYPQNSTHIIAFDTYLLSNETGQAKFDESILHSKVADPVNFEGAFFSAENKPDKVNAIHAFWDEIAIFGTTSLENFYNDGTSPFSQIPGATVAEGTFAPWSIQFVDNSYFFLDSKRHVVRVDGRQPTVLSLPIDDILGSGVSMSEIEAAKGETLTIGGRTLYLLSIGDETLVYDYALREWVGRWNLWSEVSAKYISFRARNFLNIEQWGIALCADKTTGKIYKIDFDSYQDDGQEIRSSIITGQIDHGTGREKRSNEIRLKLRRGDKARVSVGDIDPFVVVRWRDNGSKVWSNDRQIPLGFQGDSDFFYSIHQLGTYRTRQYEIYCTENTPFVLVDAEEDVELMR